MMMTALLYLLWLILFAPNECSSTGANIVDRLMMMNLKLSLIGYLCS
jgi:hypothetical protein